MKILIKQTTVVDPSSPFHGQSQDILIENGKITDIASSITVDADETIQLDGLHVSAGWMDIFANFGDPGYEFKETLETGAAAAAAGGYTDTLIIPNTNPTLHNKASIEYVTQKSKSLPINIHPLGAITRNTEGKELAEMYDMRASGAIAFTDGIHSIQSSGLLVKALQYVKAFNGILIQIPDDKSISPQGLMNEGIVSTRLGLPGKPAMAEELIVSRDIKLAKYAGSRLHFTGISTASSLDYIREAKAEGLDITCSVTPYHLFFSDEDLLQYDSNLKVNPPLRGIADRDALRKGILDGTIDCIATHHLPHEYDSKVLEFEYAKPGMIGLETAFATLRTAMPEVPVERWIELLSAKPRKIFGLPTATINKNADASLTFFQSDVTWTVESNSFKSKARNSPFIGKTMHGKVAGVFTKKSLVFNK
jgi:dihydroorotase